LKFSAHVARATNNGHQILGLIRRTFTYIDQMSMKQLYYTRTSPTTLGIRQCCVASLPKARYTIIGKVTTQSNKNDFEITAPVLRRQTENFGSAISVISQTSGRCHKNFQVYLHNYSVDSSTLIPLCQPTGGVVTRGHSLKLQKRDCKISARANGLGFRTVNFWNDLPEYLVTANSVCLQESFRQALFPPAFQH